MNYRMLSELLVLRQMGVLSSTYLGFHLVVKSRSVRWSVATRLISSGIVRSKERSPASTCATFTPSLLATNAQASVELSFPSTITKIRFIF